MTETSFRQIQILGNLFAPSQLEIFDIPNKNYKQLRDLLDRPLKTTDKGIEVGSDNYISKSSHFFIRAKALQSYSFLPFWNNETKIPITPHCYVEKNLKKGDILISKDSNIGEAIILDKDYPNHLYSGALYKLPLSNMKYYVLAFLKHEYFRKQLDILVPKGSTIRHAKTLFLDCKIPFPNQKNDKEVIEYIEKLTKSIIEKEIQIRNKFETIFNLINEELENNQGSEKFIYEYPNPSIFLKLKRIDAGIYSEYFKKEEFKIRNYVGGYKTVKKLGFDVSRGQNLQITCIGKSIYSKVKKENFYTVIKPKHISIYGFSFDEEYLGNANELRTLKQGDIIFGAEGFEKGRSLVIFEDKDKTITNIHGITINHLEKDIELSIFLKCFLDYLRRKGLIDLYAVGGNGGSLAMKYWNLIPIPLFRAEIKKKIIELYKTPLNYKGIINLSNFEERDKEFNKIAGIHELDFSIKNIKNKIDQILNDIVNNKKIDIEFNFLRTF